MSRAFASQSVTGTNHPSPFVPLPVEGRGESDGRHRHEVMRKLILKNFQSPGDIVMLTAAVRDLRRNNPGKFLIDVRTSCPALWENNPFITKLDENGPDVQIIDCHYPLVHKSNEVPRHFLEGFMDFLSKRLDVRIVPTEFKGDIYLTEAEKQWPEWLEAELGCSVSLSPQRGEGWGEGWSGGVASGTDEVSNLFTPHPQSLSPLRGEGSAATNGVPFWIIVAGGKRDFTIKWWSHERFQEVVDYFRGRIRFVQVGEGGHEHKPLNGVINLIGKTDTRELIRLMYHAQGVLCPVTLAMHLAAAVPLRVQSPRSKVQSRACFVVAGGREPMHWEAYPGHQFIHTIGALPCCATGGCWKSRTVPLGDGDEKDKPASLCVDVVNAMPHCMEMITPEEVCRRIEMYFAGGMLHYLSGHKQRALVEVFDSREQLDPVLA